MWSKSGIKITNEKLDKRLLSDYPDIKRESDYIDSKTSIIFSCVRCGKKYKKKPKEVSKIKCRCAERGNNYKKEISKKDLELIDNYINIRKSILHRCKNCKLCFNSSPKSVLNSIYGCPSCSGKIFSIDKYKSILPKNLRLLSSEYIGSNFKHKHLCVDCHSEFETKPNYILHMNTNCPICSKSKGERQIIDILDSLGLEYEKEYTVKISGKNLRFDFYIPSKCLLIEYDGIQHYKPVDLFGGLEYYEKLKVNDKLKDSWSYENNISLLRIPYNVNIESYLKNFLVK
jgi:hypothetical protein